MEILLSRPLTVVQYQTLYASICASCKGLAYHNFPRSLNPLSGMIKLLFLSLLCAVSPILGSSIPPGVGLGIRAVPTVEADQYIFPHDFQIFALTTHAE
jgi:hypothetical protein